MPTFNTLLTNGLRSIVAAALLTSAATSSAELDEATASAIDAAIASDVRSAAEKARDRNRLPKKTLEFFGLNSDMTVVEIFPGGGWYTKILAPVLAQQGQYIAAGGLGKALGFGEILQGVGEFPGKDQIKVIDLSGALSKADRFGVLNMERESLGTRKADLVLTFRNLHNLSADGRKVMYASVLRALKKSGRFGVIDHTRRHMESTTNENWRRMDPVQIIKEATDAGFQLVDFANLHHRADDELRFEVGRKSVTGNSDRFTLLFEKQ